MPCHDNAIYDFMSNYIIPQLSNHSHKSFRVETEDFKPNLQDDNITRYSYLVQQ